jgi:hypothetical protein
MVPRMKRVVVVELIAVAALVAVVVFNAGLVHVVHSRKFHRWPGIHICAKLKWTLGDTFINTDDYGGQPERVAQLDGDAVAAMVRCGVLRVPSPVSAPDGPHFYEIVIYALLDPLASLLSTW